MENVQAPDYESFLIHELRDSRSRIETATAHRVRSFCYPFGDHDEAVIGALSHFGYEAAVTTMRAPVSGDSSLFRLPRYLIHNTTTLDEFRTFLPR